MEVEGYSWTVVCVQDLERSLHFYRDLLGLKVVDQFDTKDRLESVRFHEKLFNMSNLHFLGANLVDKTTPVKLQLVQFISPPSKPRPENWTLTDIGFMRMIFRVESVDAAYEELSKKGVRFVAPPAKRPGGGANVLAYDPDGNIVPLSEAAPESK
ncbi:MAG: VOC family protein [Chloroflexi bacterium]|nr:VOC family protein [Chloroflexota bacterium]